MKPEEALAKLDDTVAQIATKHEEISAKLEETQTAQGKELKEVVGSLDTLTGDVKALSASILEMEQTAAENVNKGTAPVETLGQMVIKSDAYKQYAAGDTAKMTFQANTIIGQEGSPLENSNTIVETQRVAGIISGASRLLRIADLLPQGETSSNKVDYTRELLATNNAAETNEGVASPESVLTFELAEASVKTIKTHLKVSKQVLEDAPMLQSYIDTRLRYFVNHRIDQQLLKGDGTTPNISGMMDTGNHTAFTAASGDNALDSINKAIYAVHAADYAPTAIILNPADWGAIERIKTASGENSYVIGNPTGFTGPMLWGLPVVISNNMTAGQFLVAAFDIAYQVWNRADTTVEIYEQDEDNAQKDLLTVKASARKALSIYRAASAQGGALTV